jgi:hypothetical protein
MDDLELKTFLDHWFETLLNTLSQKKARNDQMPKILAEKVYPVASTTAEPPRDFFYSDALDPSDSKQ